MAPAARRRVALTARRDRMTSTPVPWGAGVDASAYIEGW
jgi:hypothetical protein